MQTIRQYAEYAGVSYEAVRASISRHMDELQGHVIERGNRRYLDDTAVEILDTYRAPRPVIVSDTTLQDEIERLRAENNDLKTALITTQQTVIDLQSRLLESEQQAAMLDERTAEAKQAREDAERLRAELDEMRQPRTIGQRLMAWLGR